MNEEMILVLLAVGGYFLYTYVNQTAANTVAPTAAPATTTITSPTTTSTPTSTTLTVTPWAQATQILIQQNGGDSANWDQWSYWWQNSPTFPSAPYGFGTSGSISAQLFAALLQIAGNAQHTGVVTAEQFVSALQQTVSTVGLSGLTDYYWQPKSITLRPGSNSYRVIKDKNNDSRTRV
jgi:hypothetical protein